MNKACNQQNVTKISNYFDHLKYHVMTGGNTADEVNKTINDISKIISFISKYTTHQKQIYLKTLTGIQQINQLKDNNYNEILSAVADEKDNPLASAARNLQLILKQVEEQGGKNSQIYKQLEKEKEELEIQKVELEKQLVDERETIVKAEVDKKNAVEQAKANALESIDMKKIEEIKLNLEALMTTLGLTLPENP